MTNNLVTGHNHCQPPINYYFCNLTRPRSSMDRMSDSGSEGCGFESRRGHKKTALAVFLLDD